MAEKSSEELRRLALEEVAAQQGFGTHDLDTLGRLLALKEHTKVKVLRPESTSTPSVHYEMELNESMDPKEVKQMLIDQGLVFGTYQTGKPFYDFVSEGRHRFFLKVMQPNGTYVHQG